MKAILPLPAFLFVLPLTSAQEFKLLASDGAGLDLFATSVATTGPTAIVGARRDDDNGIDSGSAYVLEICP